MPTLGSIGSVLNKITRARPRPTRSDGTPIANTGRELGAAATYARRSYLGGEEYNRNLGGLSGLREYDRMRRSDATVARALKLIKTPVLAGRWFVESADGNDSEHNKIRDFVEWNFIQGMDTPWTQFLTECLTMMEFGYSFFEKIFANTSTPHGDRTILRELAPRSPFDVAEWLYDRHGRPVGVEMFNWETRQIYIQMDRLVTFTHAQEANNIEGVSVLRPAYKHWFFKELFYKIDAIQKERHGIGVPIMTMPHQWTEKDRDTAQKIGANLRTNETTHVVLPPGWELEFGNPRGGLPVDPMDSIRYHDASIIQSILGDFLITTGQSNIDGQLEIFLKSSRYIADIIREKINLEIIPQLVNYNWPNVKAFPQLMVRRISEEVAHRELSFLLRNFVGSDIVRPDDIMEEWLRRELNLPPKDDKTERMTVSPQLPGQGGAGLPNQTTAQNVMNQGSSRGSGSDRTGGNR